MNKPRKILQSYWGKSSNRFDKADAETIVMDTLVTVPLLLLLSSALTGLLTSLICGTTSLVASILLLGFVPIILFFWIHSFKLIRETLESIRNF